MASESPLVPWMLKGAFIRLDEAPIGVVPHIIVFQYNPESLTRKFKPYENQADNDSDGQDTSPRSAPYDPEEEMDIAIEFDATDDLERPERHPVTLVTGVADRIAALEMLMYPPEEIGLLSSAVSSLAGALGLGAGAEIPKSREAPIVLFTWGPGRVLPVTISGFSVEEQAFNPALYPIRAKVTVGVKVLSYYGTPEAEKSTSEKLTSVEKIARGAYRFTHQQRKVLASANVTNSIDSILATLPF